MRQNSTLKKKNSYLCVIDTFKLWTRFLIMRHTITRARARYTHVRTCDRRYVYTYVSTRCISCIGAAAAEMATATADDVYVHWIQYCIRGYHVYQRIWYPTIGEILGFTRERDNTHDRYIRCGGVPSNVLARVHPWVSFEKTGYYLSIFCARHGYDRLWILWHVLIMRHKS